MPTPQFVTADMLKHAMDDWATEADWAKAAAWINDMIEQNRPYRRGIYRTFDGHAAYVSGPKAQTAWDIDGGHRISMDDVTRVYLRKPEPFDLPGRGE